MTAWASWSVALSFAPCGRVRLSSDVSEIKLVFSIPPHRPTPNFPPSWNAAPIDLLPVVRYERRAGERSLDLLRRGLVACWAKDPSRALQRQGRRDRDPSIDIWYMRIGAVHFTAVTHGRGDPMARESSRR